MAAATPALPRPRGLGIAVVFDWALAAQLTTQALAAATGHLGLPDDGRAIAGRLLAAVALVGLGEALRRGVAVARLVQMSLLGLVTALGAVSVVLLIRIGGRGLVASAIIELTVAPWLLSRLLARETAAWFVIAAGRGRAPRTSGATWLAVLAAWSAAWGIAVAWSQSLS